MNGDPKDTLRHRWPLKVGVFVVTVLGAWHYLLQHFIEESLNEGVNAQLREKLHGASAKVYIQPLTNLVVIEVTRNAISKNEFLDVLGGVFIEYVRAELEPMLERELATRARADVDLYAMLLPYHVSITISKNTPQENSAAKMVKEVQQQLTRLGFDIGSTDGVLGQRTKAAILNVQAQLGRAQDGKVSPELLDALRNANAAGAN